MKIETMQQLVMTARHTIEAVTDEMPYCEGMALSDIREVLSGVSSTLWGVWNMLKSAKHVAEEEGLEI